MKSYIGLFIFSTVLLSGAVSISAQNYYANHDNYNYSAKHETPRPYADRDDYRNGNEYQEQINRDRDQLNRLTSHIQSDKFKMLNQVNRGDYRSAQREAFDITRDQKDRQFLLNRLYYDGNNWQSDRSRMNAYSDRAGRDAFSRDISHGENELIQALVRNDFYAAQSIADHINRDVHYEQNEDRRDRKRYDRRN